MKSKYWLKLYHEILDDPKVARLPDSSYRRFIECLLLAGELDAGGFLPELPDMSWRLRVDETTLKDDLTRLALSGIVELKELDGSERWLVSNFTKRQAPSTAAERMRRLRKRKKETKKEKENTEEDTYIDTDTYSDVTRTVTGVTFRNDKRPLFDIPDNLKSPELEELFIKFYAHCDQRGRAITQVSGDMLLEDLSKMGLSRAVAALRHSLKSGWVSVHEPRKETKDKSSSPAMAAAVDYAKLKKRMQGHDG